MVPAPAPFGMTQNPSRQPSSPLDFAAVQQRWQAWIRDLRDSENTHIDFEARVEMDQGQIVLEYPVRQLQPEDVQQVIVLARKFIPHWRLHTFEEGYWCIQALNKNLYETEGLTDRLRVRLTQFSSNGRVQISWKGNLQPEEFGLLTELFQFFHVRREEENPDPTQRLLGLGVSVYQSTAEGEPPDKMDWSGYAGYDPVKQDIEESVVLPLKNPEVYAEIARQTRAGRGDTRPRAVLFKGQPGVGKTSIAKIMAAHLRVPLIYVPVESIMSKYYGQSSRHLASVFDLSALYDYALLFLDEIDALAGNRDQNLFEATRRVLSVLLRKMDGLESRSNVLVIGATNRAQDLDDALLSRFDIQIDFPLPRARDRLAIFGIYARHLEEAELTQLANGSKGLSPRNIKDLCERAERTWAARWIREEAGNKKSVPPPPLEIYRERLNLYLAAQ